MSSAGNGTVDEGLPGGRSFSRGASGSLLNSTTSFSTLTDSGALAGRCRREYGSRNPSTPIARQTTQTTKVNTGASGVGSFGSKPMWAIKCAGRAVAGGPTAWIVSLVITLLPMCPF